MTLRWRPLTWSCHARHWRSHCCNRLMFHFSLCFFLSSFGASLTSPYQLIPRYPVVSLRFRPTVLYFSFELLTSDHFPFCYLASLNFQAFLSLSWLSVSVLICFSEIQSIQGVLSLDERRADWMTSCWKLAGLVGESRWRLIERRPEGLPQGFKSFVDLSSEAETLRRSWTEGRRWSTVNRRKLLHERVSNHHLAHQSPTICFYSHSFAPSLTLPSTWTSSTPISNLSRLSTRER